MKGQWEAKQRLLQNCSSCVFWTGVQNDCLKCTGSFWYFWQLKYPKLESAPIYQDKGENTCWRELMVMRVVPLASVNTFGVCRSLSWKLWKRSMHILCEVIHVLLLGGHLPSLPHLITHNSATLFKAPVWMSEDNFAEPVSSFYLYKFWDQLQLFRHCRKFLYPLSHHNNSDLGFLLSQLTLHVVHSEILISMSKKINKKQVEYFSKCKCEEKLWS